MSLISIFTRRVFSGFASNTRPNDIVHAIQMICNPLQWKKWKQGREREVLRTNLNTFYQSQAVGLFDSGRSALYYALKAVGVGVDDEVIVQGYTCMVVVNAIKWTGAMPVYVDIGKDLCIDATALEKHITEKTKAIIVQHTFGKASDLETILTIAQKHSLKVIEDCAHTIGGKRNKKLLGTFGDLSIISFGSNKALSSIRGGAIIVNKKHLIQPVGEREERLPEMSGVLIFKHLLYYVIFPIAKPLYTIGIGKVLLFLVHRLHIMARLVTTEEKMGKQTIHYPTRFPNALAKIAKSHLEHSTQINFHRKKIGKIYQEQLGNSLFTSEEVPMEWICFVESSKMPSLKKALQQKNVYLAFDWQGSVIVPKGIDMSMTEYNKGMCPTAEEQVQMVVQLPTHRGVDVSAAHRIIECIKEYV